MPKKLNIIGREDYKKEAIKYIISIAIVMIVGAIFILLQGESPLKAFQAIFQGALVGKPSIARTIRWITPCIIAGTAAVISDKSGIFNLGIEGQIYMGAFFAAVFGYAVSLPKFLHIPATIIVGGIGGALLALIPALLKLYYNVNEMITTLMFNYVATLFTEYMTLQLMGADGSVSPDYMATPPMLDTARLTPLFKSYQATTGFFIGLALVLLVHILYKYTKKGYELKQVGENIKFAQYGGINALATYFYVFLISGFVAGICGAVEMMGAHGRFRAQFSSNLGWDGIMIALIAKDSPLGMLLVAVLWGIIKNGSFAMERTTNVNRLVVTLIQAIFVLFITADFEKIMSKIRAISPRKGASKKEGTLC
ncbi:MAG: ABC transporter permease [Thermoanaerobacteraceae bacterium]|nr:ABC transporter permease [Thermoanaerobacteraceae bacterium]